ncbi:hypothetical protein [Egbenema bharatensis]
MVWQALNHYTAKGRIPEALVPLYPIPYFKPIAPYFSDIALHTPLHTFL